MVESDKFTVFNSKLEGGPMVMRNTGDAVLLCLCCLIPFISGTLNWIYFLTFDHLKPKRLSGVGYSISCSMVNSYHLYIVLSFG